MHSTLSKKDIAELSTSLEEYSFTLLIFFSKIFVKCVFPEPGAPKTFNHLLDQFGQLSINL